MTSTPNTIFLIGWVQKTYNTGRSSTAFDILDNKSKVIYNCSTTEFCPTWEGDIVAGNATLTGNNTCVFTTCPMIKLNVCEEEIIKCILKSQKFTIRKDFAKKVYDSIVIYNNSSDVDNILNNMSIQYIENQNDDISPLKELMSDSQAKKLLKWWYKTRVLRRLYLLGLTNKDIRDSRINPIELYEKCLIDPFLVPSIPLDKCKRIYQILLRTYTEDQLFRATIARKLYQNTIDKAWIGTPSKLLDSSFNGINKNDIKNHVDILKKEYGIVTELFTVYLKDQHDAESKSAEVLSTAIKDNTSNIVETYYKEKMIKLGSAEYGNSPPDDKDNSVPEDRTDYTNLEYKITYNNPNLNDTQKLAVETSLKQKITIITGGAGTGKTTIISEIVHNLDELGIPYIVASYTGKAVARIKEVIKKNSPMTIHMMLARSKSILPFKYAIFDESSMITTELMYMFWKAFGTDFSMCFVGDNNQLPPISCGNFFDQLITSEVISPIVLPKNYRSDVVGQTQNMIVQNAENLITYNNILKNKSEQEFIPPFKFSTGSNFFMLNGNEDIVYQAIKGLANKGIKATDVTVITPYVKHLDSLNKNIQKIFSLGGRSYTDSKGITWALGDRVMVTKNNYSLGQMNGDEGTIIDITDGPGKSGFPEMLVLFRSGHEFKFVITYEKNGVDSFRDDQDSYVVLNDPTVDILTHCYAITIHKSQGSEWEYVIFYYPMDNNSTSFINKHLIYTADTRPRKALFVIGDIQAFELHATMNPPYRHDTLSLRLRSLCGMNN